MIPCSSSILEVGKIIRQSDGLQKDFHMTVLGRDDLQHVLQVQQKVLNDLEDFSLYYPSSEQIFEDSLGGSGIIIGAWVDDQLIAFRSIWYPRSHPENLGLEIGMQHADHLDQVAHLERSCVIPEYRGNRLQSLMTRYAIDIANQNNSFRYLFSTVAPMNYPSMKDKLGVNMVIVQLKKKYEDYYRYIFYQDILNPIISPVQSDDSHIFVDVEDIASQMQLLETNDDVHGYILQKNNEMMQIGYAKTNRPLF